MLNAWVATTDAEILRNLDSRWAEQKEFEADRTESCRNTVALPEWSSMEYSSKIWGIFTGKETHSSTMKTGPFTCTTSSLCSTQTPVSFHLTSHSCAFTSINSPRGWDILVRSFWTTGTCGTSVCPGTLSVANHSGRNENPHTVALKCHQIGNMTKTPQASLEFGVKQYWVTLPITMAPTHFQPAMSTGLASWNAAATATHRDQSCGSAHSAVSPLKNYLPVITRISNRYTSHNVRHEVWKETRFNRAKTLLSWGKTKKNCLFARKLPN